MTIKRFEEIEAWQKTRQLTANIYEATSAGSVAKGSTGEVRSQLYVALDAGLLSERQFKELFANAEEATRLISGFMRYLHQSEFRGRKANN